MLVLVAATIGYAIAMLVRNTGASLGVAFVYFVVRRERRAVCPDAVRYASRYMLQHQLRSLLVPVDRSCRCQARENRQYSCEVSDRLASNLRAFMTLTAYTALLARSGRMVVHPA